MPVDIIIPSVGESITNGVLAKWAVADGQFVKKDDVVADFETDKVTLEIRAPESGILSTKTRAGETVDIGTVVGAVEPSENAGAGVLVGAKPSPGKGPSLSAAADVPTNGKVRATPLAEKLAQEHGVDLGSIPASGAGGRVREQDVLAFIDKKKVGGAVAGSAAPPAQTAQPGKPSTATTAPPVAASPVPPRGPRGVVRERMSPLRQRIAARLVQAQHTAAMLTTFNECDMTAVMELRKAYKEDFEKKHGIGLGFMSFFIKAVVGALKAFPLVNASIVDDEGGQPAVEKHDYEDIAVAVGTPKGLVVPVLRNCDSLSFAQIEAGIKDLAVRARDGKLSLDEMQGGTFTITNGGIYGSLMSTPILNPPQSAILGMHAIKPRAIEHPVGSGAVAIRPMMYLAVSYDHRIIDGAEAVQFLVRIKQAIEDPQRLLLGL